MHWKFESSMKIWKFKLPMLDNGSLEQPYISVCENNHRNTFPIKSLESGFVSARLQSQWTSVIGRCFTAGIFSSTFWNFQYRHFLEIMWATAALASWDTGCLFQQFLLKESWERLKFQPGEIQKLILCIVLISFAFSHKNIS